MKEWNWHRSRRVSKNKSSGHEEDDKWSDGSMNQAVEKNQDKIKDFSHQGMIKMYKSKCNVTTLLCNNEIANK